MEFINCMQKFIDFIYIKMLSSYRGTFSFFSEKGISITTLTHFCHFLTTYQPKSGHPESQFFLEQTALITSLLLLFFNIKFSDL